MGPTWQPARMLRTNHLREGEHIMATRSFPTTLKAFGWVGTAVCLFAAAAWAENEIHHNRAEKFNAAVTFSAATTFESTVALQGAVALTDSDSLIFGTGSDVDIEWDGTNLIVAAAADDSLIEIGDSAATQLSFDVKWYGGEASGASYLYSDASLKFLYTEDIDIKLNDSDDLIFGDGASAAAVAGDAKIRWDGTDLDLLCTANNTVFKIGDGTTSFDVWVFGASASAYWSWDASANDLKAEDSVSLMFGTGAGAGPGNAGDVEMRWDGTDFDVLAAANNSVIKFGNGTESFDVWTFGSSASEYLEWDASRDALLLQGNAKIIPTNGVTWFDDFNAEVFDTNQYTVNSDAGGAPFAISEVIGGALVGAPDNETADKEEFAGPIIYSTSKVTVFECRIKTDDISTNAFNIGLSDAKNEAATTIAWTVGGSDAVTTTTDDGVGFAFDTRADTDGWFGVVSAATDDKEGAGGTAPVNDTYQTLRFEIDSSRLVRFYINGAAYGSASTALDASTLLCLYIAAQSTTTTTRTWTVDYVYIWQDR